MSKSISRVILALSTALFAVLATASSAAQVGVSPSALSYNQVEFTTSNPKTLLVINSGPAAITFGPASFSGTDAGDFDIATDSRCGLRWKQHLGGQPQRQHRHQAVGQHWRHGRDSLCWGCPLWCSLRWSQHLGGELGRRHCQQDSSLLTWL
jgi:hypothetical protein